MKPTSLKSLVSAWCIFCALFCFNLGSLKADTVMLGTAGGATDHSVGYSDGTGTSGAGGFTTITAKSTATNPSPYTSGTSSTTSRFNAGGGTADVSPFISLNPTLAPGSGLKVYKIFGTRGTNANATPDSVFNISYTGCTGDTASTTFFRSTTAAVNVWKLIGMIKLNTGVVSPTVKFTFHSGTTTGTTVRNHSDSYYFGQASCSDTPNVGSMNSVAANATEVTATGCSTSAQLEKVSIYDSNNVLLGENSSPGVSGTVTVTGLSPLADGTVIKAVQTVFGVESCLITAPTVTVGNPCGSVADVGGITGTIYNDASTITVTGCSASATAVRIYDVTSSTLKGENSSPGGAASVVVSVSGLVQSNTIKAVQVIGGQESCLNTAPSKVVQGPICSSVANVAGPFYGPIDAVSQSVGIRGVSTSASNVKIYQNGIQVGSTNVSSVTNVTVSCVGLVKGGIVKVTQVAGGQESCLSAAPSYTVGSGAPNVRFAIGLRNTAGATSPLGTDGGGTGTIYCLGANGGGAIALHAAPTGIPSKNILAAGSGWQTLTFTNSVDPSFNFSTGGAASSVPGNSAAGGTWAVLEGLYIAPDDPTDTGAYTVYIDNIKNGTDVFENFESRTNDQVAVAFGAPNFSGTTAANLLGGSVNTVPNTITVTTNNPDTGSNCELVSFQFSDTNAGNWVRLTTAGSTTGINPSFDVSKPISIRAMVVPVPQHPTITYNLTGSTLTLNWTGTFNLESKTNLSDANWDSVGVNTGPYITQATNSATFYRLRNP
jgi:hypothetical protein